MRDIRQGVNQMSETAGDNILDEHNSPPPVFMLVAGEASGDQHSAGVVSALLKLCPQAKVFGMGGDKLRCAGMEIVVDIDKHASVMGLTEVVGSLGRIFGAFRTLQAEAKKRKPALAILVDFPDFNLRLAKSLYKLGIPVMYFISPQLWAWRKGRVKQMKKYVAKVVPIFPFEKEFYHQHQVEAEYLGHPFLDREPLHQSKEDWLKEAEISEALPLLALLPGSRKSELERLLPPMLGAYKRLCAVHPGLQAVLPVAPTLDFAWVENLIGPDSKVKLLHGQSRECLSFSTVAVVASGTATVEAALAQVPFVVVYKLSALSYAVGRLLIRGVDCIAMANLIAGRKIVEELLQDEVNEARLALEVEKLLDDPGRRSKMRQELGEVYQRLAAGREGEQPTARRVAELALALISQQRLPRKN